MGPERWREVRAAFDQLVELTADDRGQRLHEIGTGDPELRRTLEALLVADATADDRLEPLQFNLVRGLADSEGAVHSVARELGPDPLDLSGRSVSHFHVRELLGSGGMGAVYRAEDARLRRDVALKLPLPGYLIGPSAKERFLQEGRAAGALDHPNICTVYEVGETEAGQLFLAMPLYPGETLRARLARDGPLPVTAAVEIVRQTARGLTAAHGVGIVHRDLKSANLMLLPDGTVKILDFGLAKLTDIGLTGSRSRMGTVAYMAPEQIRGEAVAARADLWALGILLYEMLTGRRPFDGEHEISIAHAIVHVDPVPPSVLRPEIPPAMEDLVFRLLHKEPAKRIASAAEVDSALGAVPSGSAGSAAQSLVRRAGTVVRRMRTARTFASMIAIGTLVVAGAVALLTRSSDGGRPEADQLADVANATVAESQLDIARERRGQGRWKEAEAAFSNAMRLDARDTRAAVELALMYSLLRRYADALVIWDQLIEREPENLSWRLSKGYVYVRMEGTVDTLAAAVRHLPAEWDPDGLGTYARVTVLRMQGQPVKAIAAIDASGFGLGGAGYAFRPKDLIRAQLYEEAGDPARARAGYETARLLIEDSVAVYPDDPRWRTALGLTYAGLARNTDAAKEARHVIELASISRDALATLILAGAAEILSRAGEKDRALELLDRLLAMPAGILVSVPLLRADPAWDSIRRDPRFEQMLLRYSGKN